MATTIEKLLFRCACANVQFIALCHPSVRIAHDLHILTCYRPDFVRLFVRSSIGKDAGEGFQYKTAKKMLASSSFDDPPYDAQITEGVS
jgi:hypothetical protein